MGIQLSLGDLQQILIDAGVVKIMGNERRRRVVVDYVPARTAMALPRDASNFRLEPIRQDPIEVVFQLEETMLGGVVYAAITVGDRVVVEPFRWNGYRDLVAREFTITPPTGVTTTVTTHAKGYR